MPRRNSPRAPWTLLGFSLAGTFLVWEVIARWVLPAPLPWRYPQIRYRPDPDLVFALRPDQHAFTADQEARVNSRGLRGETVPYQRDGHRVRILILGDSIAFGFGVSESETVAGRIVEWLRAAGVDAEVVNSSVPSYNTTQEVAYLEKEGIRYRPDWVILAACWNDINEKSTVRVSPEGWLLSAGTGELGTLTRLAESEPVYAARNFLKRSRLLYGVLEAIRSVRAMFKPQDNSELRADVLAGRDTPPVEAGWGKVRLGVQRLNELARIHQFRPLVVAFPIPLALKQPFPRSSYPRRLQEITSAEGAPFLDLDPAFRAQYHGHESLFIPYDGDHPNARGHDLAAREIVRIILAWSGSGEAADDRD